MQIEIEKPRLNPVHFIAIIGAGFMNAFAIGGVWVSLNRDIADLRSSQDRTQKALDTTAQQVSQMPSLTFQTARALEAAAENKKATEATNERIDRVIDTFGRKLDTAIDSINKVGTQVQVLSSKFEDAQGKSEKTSFRTSVVRQ